MTRKQVMHSLVKEEAEKLRKFATEEELGRLDIEWLDPEEFTECIYGQMTGDCRNGRSIKLIKSCCSRVYNNDRNISNPLTDAKLNGAPKKDRSEYWSPIEVFIGQEKNQMNKNNEMLVEYLKGERDELNFV